MRNLRANFSKQSGVTLVELTLAMIILSITAVSMSSFLSGSARAYDGVENSVKNFNKLAYAMDRTASELKKLGHSGSGGSFQINSSSSTGINFTNTDGNTIAFSYASGELGLSDSAVGATVYTLADNVSAFTFIYYEIDGTTATTVQADIEFVEFDLTITADGGDYRGKSRVALKNL